jgi:hypothetical protein
VSKGYTGTVATWEFNIAKCEAYFGVIDLLADIIPGTGLSMTPTDPLWTLQRGIDGQVARVRTSLFGARVSATISAHSATHRNLVALCVSDAYTNVGVLPFSLVDLNLGVSYTAPLAYLESIPEHTLQDSTTSIRWTIECPSLVPLAGPGLSTGLPLV